MIQTICLKLAELLNKNISLKKINEEIAKFGFTEVESVEEFVEVAESFLSRDVCQKVLVENLITLVENNDYFKEEERFRIAYCTGIDCCSSCPYYKIKSLDPNDACCLLRRYSPVSKEDVIRITKKYKQEHNIDTRVDFMELLSGKNNGVYYNEELGVIVTKEKGKITINKPISLDIKTKFSKKDN